MLNLFRFVNMVVLLASLLWLILNFCFLQIAPSLCGGGIFWIIQVAAQIYLGSWIHRGCIVINPNRVLPVSTTQTVI